jgi:hypothetical protein
MSEVILRAAKLTYIIELLVTSPKRVKMVYAKRVQSELHNYIATVMMNLVQGWS